MLFGDYFMRTEILSLVTVGHLMHHVHFRKLVCCVLGKNNP